MDEKPSVVPGGNELLQVPQCGGSGLTDRTSLSASTTSVMEEDLNAATRALQHLGELPPAQLLTTPSLHSLPLELILLIFELGPLKVGDAMMLRSVGDSLFWAI